MDRLSTKANLDHIRRQSKIGRAVEEKREGGREEQREERRQKD